MGGSTRTSPRGFSPPRGGRYFERDTRPSQGAPNTDPRNRSLGERVRERISSQNKQSYREEHLGRCDFFYEESARRRFRPNAESVLPPAPPNYPHIPSPKGAPTRFFNDRGRPKSLPVTERKAAVCLRGSPADPSMVVSEPNDATEEGRTRSGRTPSSKSPPSVLHLESEPTSLQKVVVADPLSDRDRSTTASKESVSKELLGKSVEGRMEVATTTEASHSLSDVGAQTHPCVIEEGQTSEREPEPWIVDEVNNALALERIRCSRNVDEKVRLVILLLRMGPCISKLTWVNQLRNLIRSEFNLPAIAERGEKDPPFMSLKARPLLAWIPPVEEFEAAGISFPLDLVDSPSANSSQEQETVSEAAGAGAKASTTPHLTPAPSPAVTRRDSATSANEPAPFQDHSSLNDSHRVSPMGRFPSPYSSPSPCSSTAAQVGSNDERRQPPCQKHKRPSDASRDGAIGSASFETSRPRNSELAFPQPLPIHSLKTTTNFPGGTSIPNLNSREVNAQPQDLAGMSKTQRKKFRRQLRLQEAAAAAERASKKGKLTQKQNKPKAQAQAKTKPVPQNKESERPNVIRIIRAPEEKKEDTAGEHPNDGGSKLQNRSLPQTPAGKKRESPTARQSEPNINSRSPITAASFSADDVVKCGLLMTTRAVCENLRKQVVELGEEYLKQKKVEERLAEDLKTIVSSTVIEHPDQDTENKFREHLLGMISAKTKVKKMN